MNAPSIFSRTGATPITSLESGLAYLGKLQLANPQTAQQQLLTFLEILSSSPPDDDVVLGLLEYLRQVLHFIGEEIARNYQSKALPLAPEEEILFRQQTSIWKKVTAAYADCLSRESQPPSDPHAAQRLASLIQRCLHYQAMFIVEHFRARRELPAGAWLDLHNFFRQAEQSEVSQLPVPELLENSVKPLHCSATYTAILLLDIASPYALNSRNLALVRNWAAMLAPLAAIQKPSDGAPPAFCIEFDQDHSLHPTSPDAARSAETRRLDTTLVGLQISHYLGELQKRISPSELGLGEETSSHVTQLLGNLAKPWSQHSEPRRFRRFPTDGQARVCLGFPAIHLAVSGKKFVQPELSSVYSRDRFDQLFTFRERTKPAPGSQITEPDSVPYIPAEQWNLINHSASGFRLIRENHGERVSHGQLLGVCPGDGDGFLLCKVTWLMQTEDKSLIAGLAILPGLPATTGFRVLHSTDPFSQAFLLPAIPAVRAEAALILPTGHFQSGKIIQVASGNEVRDLRLLTVMERGMDFERVAYEAV